MLWFFLVWVFIEMVCLESCCVLVCVLNVLVLSVSVVIVFHRPLSQAGRPVSGFLRPGTQTGKPLSMEQAIKAPRTSMTARYSTFKGHFFHNSCMRLPGSNMTKTTVCNKKENKHFEFSFAFL